MFKVGKMNQLMNETFLDVPLLKHQLDFVTDVDTPNLGLVGGYGCGKTYSFAMKGVHLASLNIGYTGVLLEPTYSMVSDTLVPMMDQVLDEAGLEYTFRGGQPEYNIRFADGWSTIKLRSAENYRRLAGMNLAWFGVDEIDTITNREETKKIWRMLQSRKRFGKVRQGFTTSTPEGYGFLYDYFVVNSKLSSGANDDSRRMIQASTYDNPFLPEDYITGLEKAYPAHLIKAYLNGEFVNLTTGNVYHQFNRELNSTKFLEKDFHSSWPMYVCVDFNENIMATAIIFIDQLNNTIFIVDEIFGEKDTTSLINRLKRTYPKRRLILSCDASGAYGTGITPVALFSNAGFNTSNVDRSNPVVRDRVNAVNAKLCNGSGQRTLLVNIDMCPNVVQTFEQQGYKNGDPDKTGGLDHMADALGYCVWKKFPIKSARGGRVHIHG